MTTSRELTRDALVTLLDTALVSALAQGVIGHKPTGGDLQGKRVLVAVLSGGSLRRPFTMQGNRSSFRFEVQVWVLLSGDGWTVAQAEDRLDAVEQKVAETYEANRRASGSPKEWDVLSYADFSMVQDVKTVQGVPYLVEGILTLAQLMRS